MEEFVKLIFNYGGTVVLAALFVYVFFSDRKEKKDEKEKNNKILNELSTSNNNIAESLNLLRSSIDINTAEYRQHDERAIKEFSNINEHLVEIKAKLDK